MASRNPLTEPVLIDRFWRSRRKDALVTSLRSYEGHNLVDIRTHFMSREGKLLPTTKGVSISILRLPDLVKSVTKALKRARELGLIPDEAGE
jgi:hypothetical protein